MATRTDSLTFSDLDDSAKSRAIDSFASSIEPVDFSEFAVGHFVESLAEQGIDVSTNPPFANGRSKRTEPAVYWDDSFSPRFTASVDVLAFMRHHKICNRFRAIYSFAAANGYLRANVNEYGEIEIEWTGYETPAAEAQYPALCEVIEGIIDTLSRELQHDLRDEYEYQTSEESIIETIQANDYGFDAEGRIAA